MPLGETRAPSPEELARIYQRRFGGIVEFRARMWRVLVRSLFQNLVRTGDAVLDLGCGYGEFVNAIGCGRKYAMDLNASAQQFLDPSVTFIHQDCSTPWPIPPGSLDVVFTSNFLEHLPSKLHVDLTLEQARRSLKPGGRMILMGPNIRFLAEAYWDFWDHYIPISHVSLVEALRNRGFDIVRVWPRFLPFTMAGRGRSSISATLFEVCLKIYLSLPLVWPIFGRQFLVIATPRADAGSATSTAR
jgi:SAM-dependent methyltransferase